MACLVVLSYPELEVIYEAFERLELGIPYISGFLAFREVSAASAIERVAMQKT